jgi:hypothetical protein
LDQTIIVAGFHRSGTSLATQLIHNAGVFVGEDLIGAMPSNPFGHFEDREIVSLHDAILGDHGLTWQVTERFIPRLAPDRWLAMEGVVRVRNLHHRIWGFKDPRVCLFLPVWKHLVPNARTVIIYRSWLDSTSSLERRHAADLFEGTGSGRLHRRFWEEPDLALRMWVSHNEGLVAYARDHASDVMVVPFSALTEGYPLIGMINARWGLNLNAIPTTSVFEAAATQPRFGKQPISNVSLINRVHRVWDDLVDVWGRQKREFGV